MLVDFTKVIELSPDGDFGAYLERGAVHFDLTTERRVADWTMAVKIKPNDPWAHADRGQAYRALGELDLSFVMRGCRRKSGGARS